MKTYIYSQLTTQQQKSLCERKAVEMEETIHIVAEIEREILQKGVGALKLFSKKFDGVEINDFCVSKQEIISASISEELAGAIRLAAQNIRSFHDIQKPNPQKKETMPGVTCWREFRAIDSVGLYIPGGSAPLFSSLLMLAIPAQIAGCKNILVCTPPKKDGSIAPEILFTAKLLGIKNIFRIGGAQAVFAMTHGIGMPKAEKIFGPGNRFVTAAKMLASRSVAIDMPAGPSEVLVIADEKASPKLIAADLLSQCEHGPDSQAVLFCLSSEIENEVQQELQKQLQQLPRRDIAESSLNNSFSVICDTAEQMLDFSNEYAPEHLILHCEDWRSMIPKIQNAGSVFCGKYAPESVGDYSSGTNHTLPTSGFAKSYSGVNVESYGKMITFQHLTQNGLMNLADATEEMANAEGLFAHKNAVFLRRT